MSTALGISAVSAVLESLLNSMYQGSAGLGSVAVSAIAPDIIQSTFAGGGGPSMQVNLFLHQVSYNAAWRNVGLPSLSSNGSMRLSNQPLALDLHYLLTAYATADCEAEALLGYAVQLLHENPVVARSDIQAILTSPPAPPPLPNNTNLSKLLGNAGLADQIEMIKLTPAVLGREEMAWLWTALKADYRPTFPFQASVVLIQARNPSQAPLPVASRYVAAQAGLLPAITSIVPPPGQAVAVQGDTVTVQGNSLGDATRVVLSNAQLGLKQTITPDRVSATSVEFSVPINSTGLPAGVHSLSVQVQPPGLSTPLHTNSLPFALAPQIISGLPVSVASPAFTLNPTCSPDVLSKQQVSLVLGTLEVQANPFSNSTNTPTFDFKNISPGTYWVRLRVDGIDSPVAYTSPPSSLLLQVT